MHGFTLIELMIAVVVVAILASIAYPSYQGYLRRNACEAAKASLTGLANAMERFRAQQGTYVGAATDGVPNIYATQSPEQGTAQFNLVVGNATATTFSISATPVQGGLWGGAANTLTLTSTGVRSGGASLVNAWDRCPSN
ncbi:MULTISPECIES: type IV pilin protein [Metapseudomonas]|jgi:type IV pilus assembly protein PilE|uniref:Type IV pilus biogenesis protein PilE n=1 Tax=Metapseudomonas furukawaii TaxID=1149133 RepID=A0AAD1BWR9_METFU|nr:type IV pilin protein [Pseudomonas furukawaii]BAU72545.1 type IV pilus biogenesis protein PilE [Pseudomonas furukawaii]